MLLLYGDGQQFEKILSVLLDKKRFFFFFLQCKWKTCLALHGWHDWADTRHLENDTDTSSYMLSISFAYTEISS